MAGKFGVVFQVAKGQSFSDYMTEKHKPVAEAATKAMHKVGDDIKAGGRRSIAGAGFPTAKPEKAFRVDVYPKGGKDSLQPAVYAYSKIPYFGVFETGESIPGPVWIPLKTSPPRIGRKRASPAQFRKAIGPKSFVRNVGGRRYWFAPISVPKSELKRGKPVRDTVSESRLRRGQSAATGRSAIRWVPLFVELPSVTVPKKISVQDVVARARAALPGYFANFLNDDEG